MMSKYLEEEFLIELQHIETAIIDEYRQNTDLLDAHVSKVVQAVVKILQSEQKKQLPRLPRLTELQQSLFEAVKTACDERIALGNTRDEIIICLKRIQKSVTFWSKSGGRQGYLNYIGLFIPPE